MFGQGSPQFVETPRTVLDRCPSTRSYCALLVASLAMFLATNLPLAAEEVDLQLRAAWGGGTPRLWEGRITVEPASGETLAAGPITEVMPLGLSPDEPGSMHVRDAILSISPRLPRDYDGVDFRLRVPREATLVVELGERDKSTAAQQVMIPVARLIDDLHSTLLDDRGNQLRVRRKPGDRLRVRFDRDNLVFRGGERFEFYVTPHLLGAESGSSLTCDLALREVRDTQQIWEHSHEVRTDAQGSAPEIGPFSVALPDRDGIF
ncbi:MAG: hypothetical protein JJ992_14450, partial [Planctomycetes bacterium]|nr:hypothetical protein [Planctomycetota bacterium]